MKPWLINILVIITVLVISALLTNLLGDRARFLILLGILVLAYAAYLDAKKLGIDRYEPKFFSQISTPNWVFIICALIWIVGLPVYISYRYKIIHGQVPLKKVV